MERTEWLKQMREKAEELYDRLSPEYWIHIGLYPNEAHLQYLQEFLARVPPHGTLLSAACGAGRYDGILLEAGHTVIGTDQSAGMLRRAQEYFPQARYEKIGLQELDFHQEFEGAICMDAMEHICPEDYPVILRRLQEALKQGGVLYFTAEPEDTEEAQEASAAYERARAKGLPVVPGEVADEVDELYAQVKAADGLPPGDILHRAVYRYYPSLEQVRAWIQQADMTIEVEGTGDELQHFILRKT